MKKRIGNDIQFTWHIYRKSGETQTPESFDGKEVEVKLISPLQRPVTIEDVSIATGVVMFTFKGKHQVTLGNYVAILLENKGEDGMVTLDVVNAVTLVAHSYMEEDGDEGDVIEAESVELTSTISAGGGGGIEQQQADWAQTDDTAVNFIRHKPDLDVYCRKDADNTHSDGVSDTFAKLVYDEHNPSVLMQADRLTVGGDSIKFYHSYRGEGTKELLLQLDDVEKIKRTATAELDGLMSATDKQKITDIEAVIPEQASPSNKLADIDLMNSSIATATATFRGAFNLVTDLSLTTSATHAEIATALSSAISTADNNDYCFVQVPTADATPTEIVSVERYKYNGSAWVYEYTLNNSGFTAAQWEALNSGITSGLVAKLSALPTSSELTTLLSGKANVSDIPTALADLSDGDRVDDVEDALSESVSETIHAADYTSATTSIQTDNITINPVTVHTKTIYIYSPEYLSVDRMFSTVYGNGNYIMNIQIAQAGTVNLDFIRKRYYSGYYPIVYIYFTPTNGEKTKVYEMVRANNIPHLTDYIYIEPTVSVDVQSDGTLSIELWQYDIDTYTTNPAYYWIESSLADNSRFVFALTNISFGKSTLIDVPEALGGKVDKETGKGLSTNDYTTADKEKLDSLAPVATSGSYNDLSDRPTIPAAQVQANWNESDTTSKAYIQNKPTIPTVPTNVSAFTNDAGYLTQHQDISGKADKATTLAGYGITDAKIQNGVITLGSNTITPITQHQSLAGYATEQWVGQQGYLTQHQDISGKEDKMPIATASGQALTAQVGKYYRLDNVGTLAITLPTITGATQLQGITFLISTGASPAITFEGADDETILYQDTFGTLDANGTYEVTALWNGTEWTLTKAIYN